MSQEIIKDKYGNVVGIRLNGEKDFHAYGEYAEVPVDATQEQIEQLYWNVWRQAKAFCKKAGADPIKVQMIVQLLRCEAARKRDCGYAYESLPSNAPIMTIGWKVVLTSGEKAKLSKEDIACLAGGAFVEEE